MLRTLHISTHVAIADCTDVIADCTDAIAVCTQVGSATASFKDLVAVKSKERTLLTLIILCGCCGCLLYHVESVVVVMYDVLGEGDWLRWDKK